MKVRILNTIIVSGNIVSANEVLDVEDNEGQFLINLGKAELYVAKKKASKGK
ncbi:hypothetical protein OAD15_05900 [Hyphomicrobiales bacterium]|nr:hypothetical protein [Hyphomicrobiales bacterium]